jgi:hypothetical protein
MSDALEAGRGGQRVDALRHPRWRLRARLRARPRPRDAVTLVVLGVLAGAFIALGAIFMTVVLTGAERLP